MKCIEVSVGWSEQRLSPNLSPAAPGRGDAIGALGSRFEWRAMERRPLGFADREKRRPFRIRIRL